jgi:Transposase IS116/IS110/IS902 family/Transposase
MLMSWARRSEDLTFDKTDDKDAVIIARLAAQLRCYVPEPVDGTWGRLRHLGARREQLLVESGSQVQQMRALLECVWPAALQTARQPFRSSTWTAAMSIVVDRDGGDLARTRRLGLARFETAVRREVVRRGRQKPCLRIVRLLFAALTDPAGVIAHRPGALERVALLLGDWLETHRRLLDTETRMTTILDELRLTELVTSITGLSVIGAAAILAETGDPSRFASARALVKHAGPAPREKLSGTFVGRWVKGPAAGWRPGSPVVQNGTVELVERPCCPLALRLVLIDAVFQCEAAEPQPAARVRVGVGGLGEGPQFGVDRFGLGEMAEHDFPGLRWVERGDEAQTQGLLVTDRPGFGR